MQNIFYVNDNLLIIKRKSANQPISLSIKKN